MLLFDAHLDLAMNALEWNRDLTRPLAEIRAREARLRDRPDRGHGTVCLPELRRGGVRLVVATQIARVEHHAYSPVPGWASPAQAWAMTQAQRAWYQAQEEAGELLCIASRASLDTFLSRLENPPPVPPDPARHESSPPTPPGSSPGNATPDPIGFVLSLEGADSLIDLHHLERAWDYGLRVLGPAHYGPGRYANGTGTTEGFPPAGRELLREMDRLGCILDVTHLSDACFREALDLYQGPIWASHHNCRALVPHQRQLDDAMIRELVRRHAVIGIALDAWMLIPGWERSRSTPQAAGLTLQHALDHLDHICQIAGNARHVGIGSDLDGAFGTEQTPQDVQSVADLPRLLDGLAPRGYSPDDIQAVAHANFIRFLRNAWPTPVGPGRER